MVQRKTGMPPGRIIRKVLQPVWLDFVPAEEARLAGSRLV